MYIYTYTVCSLSKLFDHRRSDVALEMIDMPSDNGCPQRRLYVYAGRLLRINSYARGDIMELGASLPTDIGIGECHRITVRAPSGVQYKRESERSCEHRRIQTNIIYISNQYTKHCSFVSAMRCAYILRFDR